MHEMSIVQALIEQVGQEVARANHGGRIVGLDLAVGRLSGVHCDALRFALDVLAPGTILENAEVRITEPPAVCRCLACEARTEIDEFTVECPQCGSGNIRIEGGRDLMLQSIEVEPTPS